MSRVFPDRFDTPHLILRPIAAADAPAIFAGYAQDQDVVRYLTWRRHQTIVETEAYIAGCLTKPAASARTYVLIARTDGQLLGAFALTEALSEVADWALRQGDIWRIGAVCDVENLASARVMEKSGFEREGILRRWLVHPNISPEPRNCFSYAKYR
jgi:ribosomal-protein-alanine N-acetyltransferase